MRIKITSIILIFCFGALFAACDNSKNKTTGKIKPSTVDNFKTSDESDPRLKGMTSEEKEQFRKKQLQLHQDLMSKKGLDKPLP